jgi:hypothetical protein
MHPWEFVYSEEPGQRSRDNVLFDANLALNPGDLVAEHLSGAAVAAAVAGNTGNATCSAVVVGAGVLPGVARVEFVSATEYEVFDAQGNNLGVGKTTVAFNAGGLTFTFTAGGTPCVAGDSYTITVAAGNLQYCQYNPAGIDGSQTPVGIIGELLQSTSSTKTMPIITRDAVINGADLLMSTTAYNGANSGQILAANAALNLRGIIVRPGA